MKPEDSRRPLPPRAPAPGDDDSTPRPGDALDARGSGAPARLRSGLRAGAHRDATAPSSARRFNVNVRGKARK
jgi:hypothetical protein